MIVVVLDVIITHTDQKLLWHQNRLRYKTLSPLKNDFKCKKKAYHFFSQRSNIFSTLYSYSFNHFTMLTVVCRSYLIFLGLTVPPTIGLIINCFKNPSVYSN